MTDDNSAKLATIRAFIAAGYALIPLKGKKPFTPSWEETKPGEHSAEALAAGDSYGVVLGAEDLVCDFDPRNFDTGDNPYKRIMEIAGVDWLRGALIVKTGGKVPGRHVYLKKPASLSVCYKLKTYRGVEWKSGPGQQVVGPGSIHPDTGARYEVVEGAPVSIPQAPAALLELVKRVAKPFPSASTGGANGAGTNGYHDEPANVHRYESWLRLDAPVSGTYAVALRGRDLGLSPYACHAAIMEHWVPRRMTPRTEDEIKERVAHAYTYAKGAVGNAHPAAHFTPITSPSASSPADGKMNENKGPEPGLKGWKLDGKKQLIRCFQNTLNFFALPTAQLRGVFGFNEFVRRIEFVGAPPWGDGAYIETPIQDVDLQRLRAHLARNHGYDACTGDLVDALGDVSQARRFHPVRAYLNGLKWDGIARLDTWLFDYLGAEAGSAEERLFVSAAGRKTLCAAVARVFEPGCKFDHVLVLEGAQGIGKSGVCKILGGDWFSDFKMSASDKDSVQMMQGKWIVEMAELHTTRQTDMDTLKAFLTRQVDEARFAYGRLPGQYPRQGIFIATYNPSADGTYLKDDTGNRRWWPVKCHGGGVPPGAQFFDFAGLAAARDQLFAEAVARWRGEAGETRTRTGEALTMETNELRNAANVAQEKRRREHPWAERVGTWMHERDQHSETKLDFYTGREIWVGAMNGGDSRFGRREAIDVAHAMKDLGWEPGFQTLGRERSTRGYWRPKLAVAVVKTEGSVSSTAEVRKTTDENAEKKEQLFGDWA